MSALPREIWEQIALSIDTTSRGGMRAVLALGVVLGAPFAREVRLAHANAFRPALSDIRSTIIVHYYIESLDEDTILEEFTEFRNIKMRLRNSVDHDLTIDTVRYIESCPREYKWRRSYLTNGEYCENTKSVICDIGEDFRVTNHIQYIINNVYGHLGDTVDQFFDEEWPADRHS